jgi:hypothetical protein
MLLARADEVIDEAALLRLLTAGFGTPRQFAAVPNFGSDWSEADILRAR